MAYHFTEEKKQNTYKKLIKLLDQCSLSPAIKQDKIEDNLMRRLIFPLCNNNKNTLIIKNKKIFELQDLCLKTTEMSHF